MMTRAPTKTATWILSLWLAATLALAPVATALAADAPAKATEHGAMMHGEKAPCDTPCKHCEGDEQQQACKSHCAGATVSIAPAVQSVVPRATAMRPPVRRTFAPAAFVRPPDTPPPRTFPV